MSISVRGNLLFVDQQNNLFHSWRTPFSDWISNWHSLHPWRELHHKHSHSKLCKHQLWSVSQHNSRRYRIPAIVCSSKQLHVHSHTRKQHNISMDCRHPKCTPLKPSAECWFPQVLDPKIEWLEWLNILKVAKQTSGTGAKTVHSIRCTFIKKQLWNHLLTYANSAKQRKKMETAKYNGFSKHTLTNLILLRRFISGKIASKNQFSEWVG